MDKLMDAEIELSMFPQELAVLYKTPLKRRLERAFGEDAEVIEVEIIGSKVLIDAKEGHSWVMEAYGEEISNVVNDWFNQVVADLTARIVKRLA